MLTSSRCQPYDVPADNSEGSEKNSIQAIFKVFSKAHLQHLTITRRVRAPARLGCAGDSQ